MMTTMKRNTAWLASLGLAAALGAAIAGCGSNGAETCNPFGGACPKGGTLQDCCDATSCHYVASDGTDFPCDNTDCSAALMMATTWCQTH
jgi:hypothetical protein